MRSNFPKYVRAANVIGSAYKSYKGRSKSATKTSVKREGLQGITTFQKDVKQVYRYKKAPRRLRTRWRKDRKTFTSNLLKAEGSRKFHYHGSQTWATAANQQGFYGWFTYGFNGNGGADGSGDVGDIFTRLDIENRTRGTVADQNENGANSRRMFFDHMRSRVVLTNTGTTPIFWEVYECLSRNDIPITPEGGNLINFEGYMQSSNEQATLDAVAGAAQTKFFTSATSLPSVNSSGVTPFQFRKFCQAFKILKVTRLQAAPGNTVSFDASQPRNITVAWDTVLPHMAKKNITKLYLVRQWGAVTSANPNNSPSSAVFEVEKDYNVKVLDTHLPQLNYMTYTA